MTKIFHLNQVVQVKKMRGFGYATVDLISHDGAIKQRDKTLVVKFPESVFDAVQAGSLWQVSGREVVNEFTVNDFTIFEYTLHAHSVKYLRPSGKVLSRWISSNVPGIGGTIANRLVRLPGLQEAISSQDTEKLLSVSGMTRVRTQNLIRKWPDEHLYEVIDWLDVQNLPLGLGHKLIDIFGSGALEKIKEHPFLMMAMGASFEKTMEIAKALGLDLANESILAGVAQHYAVRYSFKTGSTVIDAQSLKAGCEEITGSKAPENIGEIAVSQRLLVKVDAGYQVYGAALQEAAVATFLIDCLKRAPGANSIMAGWEKLVTDAKVAKALSKYEKTLDFPLTNEQKEAVKGAVMSPVCGISGGAGTGKTTILKAVIGVHRALSESLPVCQVALSGRAAQRMSESTGIPAQSIAKLIYDHVGKGKPELPSHLLLIIDEASMVDLLSMYRLIGILPDATRMIFVGDTEQLPPVGAGLIFHSLTNTSIPFFHLSQVKRQDKESGIHKFASSIRRGSVDRPAKIQKTLADSSDCVLEEDSRVERLIEIWLEAGGIKSSSIILSPIRKGELGVNNINKKLQEHAGSDREPLSYSDDVRGWIPWCSSIGEFLLEGDPILITKNNYDVTADLRNGDIGVIVAVYDEPDDNGCVGQLLVNGEVIHISPGLLEKMSLGYAVTVHKSQGSQWDTCIVAVPKESEAMIDKTLIYTAATRPINRLVVIGDFRLVENAVEKGAVALKRSTYLKERLSQAVGGDEYKLNNMFVLT